MSSQKDDADRMARLDRMLAEQAARRYVERERRGECACGNPKAACRPEVCSHWAARDAMWGNA